MKKIMLIATAVVMALAVAMPVNAQSRKDKKAAKKAAWEARQQFIRDSTERANKAKLEAMDREQQEQNEDKALDRAAKKAEKEAETSVQRLKAANAQKAIAARLGQKIYMPCIEESYDKPGEYMAGYGVAEGEMERGAGIANANRYAIADITTRYIGMIKNGISQYTKNVNIRTGNKVKENELEGAAEAIGTKLIEKYANAICRDAEWADNGTYTCYAAIHVPIKEVVNATADELGVIQTDLDRKKFREYMQSELDKQAEAAQAEKDEVVKMRQEAGL